MNKSADGFGLGGEAGIFRCEKRIEGGDGLRRESGVISAVELCEIILRAAEGKPIKTVQFFDAGMEMFGVGKTVGAAGRDLFEGFFSAAQVKVAQRRRGGKEMFS